MNTINYLKNKDGFTLIELMIVIVIAGIIIIIASNLFISGYNFFSKNEEKQEIQNELRFITNYIDESIKYSNSVSVGSSVPILDSNETAIGYDANDSLIKIYNSDGTNRNLSNIIIDQFTIEIVDENAVKTTVNKTNEYKIETNILLNNASFDSADVNNTGSVIVFESSN
ncbi:prepilin-type N-terminal cleavage/methylation domain-containing protein [Halanaerobium saccharolyticum]|uniref:Prepilin-type N-terminal cleavage/methylation domain-containing protein n=1 Tax=Halanaerobium saccharolyticum TaxID=43595 RepID=A0A4R6SBP5_9FIRM|nr:prepilin-type N-terminal cleavage/methylation domain-containing protein [Halanaerobium saccharolyticum]TDP96963.1 prepilin-type N-terminal cleavage/methylation domain-containing protein [Halanaerobium saccharolyticum]